MFPQQIMKQSQQTMQAMQQVAVHLLKVLIIVLGQHKAVAIEQESADHRHQALVSKNLDLNLLLCKLKAWSLRS